MSNISKPDNGATTRHEGIEIGDTVWSSKYGYWWLHGRPELSSGVVVKKSDAGRLGVKGSDSSGTYTDRLWFKTRQEAWAHWQKQCDEKITSEQRVISELRSFRGTLHD